MSWDSWIERITMGGKTANNAGIYGNDGNPWSQTPNFNVSPQEITEVIKLHEKGGGGSIMIANEKYIVLRTDGDCLIAKCNKKGLTFAKAKTCVLIGQYEDGGVISPGNNCSQVCAVKDQLENAGM